MDTQNQSRYAGLQPFKPGQSGNPGGRPVAARTRLTARFLNDLADDYETDGKAAIRALRTDRPDAYIKVIASLCPKEIELKRPLEEMAENELLTALSALASYLAQTEDRGGISLTGEIQQPEELPALPETA
jgi:hypothetical protein